MADLTCPSCGGPPREDNRYHTRWLECKAGCFGYTEDRLWNRRVPYLPVEDVETLKEYLDTGTGKPLVAAIIEKLEGKKINEY